jgi:hypothetical protein
MFAVFGLGQKDTACPRRCLEVALKALQGIMLESIDLVAMDE